MAEFEPEFEFKFAAASRTCQIATEPMRMGCAISIVDVAAGQAGGP